MRPLTDAIPKELLPLGSVPMIHRAVEEALAAGIQEIGIIIRNGKEIIREYLTKRGTGSGGRNSPFGIRARKLSFLYQREKDGLGGALRTSREFVGNDNFLMLIPDQILAQDRFSASEQLLAQYKFDSPAVLSSLIKIPKKELRYFSGSRGFALEGKEAFSKGVVRISAIVSEHETGRAFKDFPFEIRGFGRTIFPAAIFAYLGRRFLNRKTREVDLKRTFEEFPKRIPHYGCMLRGRACDLGSVAGYYRYMRHFNKEL